MALPDASSNARRTASHHSGGSTAIPRHLKRKEHPLKLLVTGGTGFVGHHLLHHLPGAPLLSPEGEIVDVNDLDALTTELEAFQPEAVIHLAAQTFVPDSFADPHATFQTNVMGTLNLLCALERTGFQGRMVFVGSSEVYGKVASEALPITEEQPIRPRNPYAASKAAAEALAYQWSQTAGFEIVLTRPFNHTGPGQSDQFVISQWARRIVEIKKGLREPVVTVGDIEVTRDFCDVRDVVRAYGQLLDKGVSGEVYNICSGVEQNLSQVLAQLLTLAGVEAEIRPDTGKFRPSEQRRMAGSREKLFRRTGWAPEISLQTTLADTLAFWEKKVG